MELTKMCVFKINAKLKLDSGEDLDEANQQCLYSCSGSNERCHHYYPVEQYLDDKTHEKKFEEMFR